jgi:rhomboid family GlyGly-CTERM serine protease
LFCLGVSVCAVVLLFWPSALADFRYDRAALLSGEFWRVITGHVVHLNSTHLLLNLFALYLTCELLWRDMSWLNGCGLLISSAMGISGLFWWLHPELGWYAGLSGALHGLWAGCALSGWYGARGAGTGASVRKPSEERDMENSAGNFPRFFFSGALILLAVKLALEFHFGPSAHTEQMIEGPVISIAHLYGAAIGLAYVSMERLLFGLHGGK